MIAINELSKISDTDLFLTHATRLRGFDSKKYIDYNDAIKFVHSLKLKSKSEWSDYIKGQLHMKPHLPDNIPKDPFTDHQCSTKH